MRKSLTFSSKATYARYEPDKFKSKAGIRQMESKVAIYKIIATELNTIGVRSRTGRAEWKF